MTETERERQSQNYIMSDHAAEKLYDASPASGSLSQHVQIHSYEEWYTWPLTSSTTCYTGTRHATSSKTPSSSSSTVSSPRSTLVHFATERHAISLNLGSATILEQQKATNCEGKKEDKHKEKTAAPKREPVLSWREAKYKPSLAGGLGGSRGDISSSFYSDDAVACTGYSCLDDWEAIVLVDRTQTEHYVSTVIEEEQELCSATTGIANAAAGGTGTSQQQQQQHGHIGSGDSVSIAVPYADDSSMTIASTIMGQGGGGVGGNSTINTKTTLPSLSTTVIDNTSVSYAGAPAATSGDGGVPSSDNINGINSMNNPNGVVLSSQRPKSVVILRNNRTDKEYRVSLNIRTVSPTICRLKKKNASDTVDDAQGCKNENNRDDCVGLWLGSPDNNMLQFWRPSRLSKRATTDNGTSATVGGTSSSHPSLQNVDLDDRAFQFVSPIMGLDCSCHCCSSGNTNTSASSGSCSFSSPAMHSLAVVCQDGTIRLINFDWEDSGAQMSNLLETTVIVDGPLVCVSLQVPRSNDIQMHAVVGSLCGYVCELWLPAAKRISGQSSNVNQQQQEEELEDVVLAGGYWEGPKMVDEGYWNDRIQTEDSVLAVHAYRDRVAVGTHAGRCLVYVKRISMGTSMNDGGQNGYYYELQWSCQLPYSIHGICFVDVDECHSSINSTRRPPPYLVVTTRRSVHVFISKSIIYDVDLAKSRLERLLAERGLIVPEEQNAHSENATSTCGLDEEEQRPDVVVGSLVPGLLQQQQQMHQPSQSISSLQAVIEEEVGEEELGSTSFDNDERSNNNTDGG